MRESRPCSCESRSPEPPALRPATLDSRFRGSTGVPRRTLLAAGATLALPGCAATLAQPLTPRPACLPRVKVRSEEHTSEFQSLMRTSYAVFCLQKKIRRFSHLITHYPHAISI